MKYKDPAVKSGDPIRYLPAGVTGYVFLGWLSWSPQDHDMVYRRENGNLLHLGKSGQWEPYTPTFEVGKKYKSDLNGQVHEVVAVNDQYALTWSHADGRTSPSALALDGRSRWIEV